MKTIAFFLITAFLIGCTHSKEIYFSDDIKVANAIEVPHQTLKGKLVISDAIGGTYLEIVDDYLLIATSKLDTLFHLYFLNGEYITGIGVRGNGPNDFINCRPTGQSYSDTTGCYVWINDVSAAELKRIDIERSVQEKSSRVDKHLMTLPMSVNAFYVNDSTVIQEVLEENNCKLVSFCNKQVMTEEVLYKIDQSPVTSYYGNISRIDEHNHLIISAMYSINQVNFLNYKTGKRFSACVGNVTPKEDIIDIHTGLSKWVYYANLRIADNFIYALYINQNYNDAYEKEKEVQLHVFDVQGRLCKIFILDEYIINIAIDETRKILYGLSGNDCIYAYALP